MKRCNAKPMVGVETVLCLVVLTYKTCEEPNMALLVKLPLTLKPAKLQTFILKVKTGLCSCTKKTIEGYTFS